MKVNTFNENLKNKWKGGKGNGGKATQKYSKNSCKVSFKTNQFPFHRKVELIGKNGVPTTQVYKIVISPLVLYKHPRVQNIECECDGQRLKVLTLWE